MLRVIFLIVLTLFSCSARSTKQIDDTLSVGRSFFYISQLPLESLSDWKAFAQKTEFELCSGSWRGYQASWEIRDGFLWLLDVEKNPCDFRNSNPIQANEFLAEKEYPIRADWFSGKIQLQIDETEYFFEDDDEEKELLGVDYEVLTFNFENGELTRKFIELIQQRHEH